MRERTRRALAAFLEGQHTALIERAMSGQGSDYQL